MEREQVAKTGRIEIKAGLLTTRTSPPVGEHTAHGKLHVGEAGLQALQGSNPQGLMAGNAKEKRILMLVTTVKMTLFRTTVTERERRLTFE